MSYEIICEDFKITESIRSCVQENLQHIETLLREDTRIHVFLSEPAEKLFRVILDAKLKHNKEIVVDRKGNDLYKLIQEARKLFEQNYHKQKGKLRDSYRGK